jgi:glycine cleavage system aminomethyltransferase T
MRRGACLVIVGAGIDPETDSYEAGLGWAVRLKKGDFIGRDALLAKKKKPLERGLACMTLDDPESVVLGRSRSSPRGGPRATSPAPPTATRSAGRSPTFRPR